LTTGDIQINVIEIMLGEFEYLLLTASVRLGDDAYGAAIHREIESITGRRCSIGALQITLHRLEKKGFLKTWMGNAAPRRGGRCKRMVQVNAEGVQAATAFYNAIAQMSRGVSWEAR
jgi:DNA-binding PadR family transcriptional regulator